MKDIEKIKSEDLGCQVQDANPGNFAIEQEVGAMVGATVPAPSAPSADDARELGAQLLVFLRRALTPIKSALRTALAAIYAHLDSRCTAYTPAAYASYIPRPYDPMGTPRAPRTLPNLLTAITAFAPRKISVGEGQVPDGVSYAHIAFGGLQSESLTSVGDNNPPYDCSAELTFPAYLFGGLSQITANLRHYTVYRTSDGYPILFSSNNLQKLHLPELVNFAYPDPTFSTSNTYNMYNRFVLCDSTSLNELYAPKLKWACWILRNSAAIEKIELPELEFISISGYNNPAAIHNCSNLKELILPKLHTLNGWYSFGGIWANCTKLQRIVLGTLRNMYYNAYEDRDYNSDDLIDFEICADGGKLAINFDIKWWNPTNVLADADKTATFLQNFLEHILSRLSTTGGNYTLTLSQAVRDAIHDGGLDQYKPSNWTITPNPTNT